MPAGARNFSPETLKSIRRLEIRMRRMVNDLFAGRYLSTFKGRGMTFSEVREYEPGDDIRTIDWNVTARINSPYVKRFAEERELTILLVVDNSASLKFGTHLRTKHALAAELGALIAFTALRNNDKTGLLLFSDRIERYVAPKKTRLHALRIIRDIFVAEPGGNGTSMGEALAYLNRVQRKRAIVFIFSDFLAEDYQKQLAVTQQHHDTIAFVLDDPRERELPDVGRIELEDLETGRLLDIDTGSRKVRDRFAAIMSEARARRDAIFKRLGMDAIKLQTGQPYVKPLMAFFDARAKRFR